MKEARQLKAVCFLHGFFITETEVCPPMKRTSNLYRMLVSAILLALGLVLPFLTGQIPAIGSAISPMHIPAFIAGLTCGPVYGAIMAFIMPLLRSVLFGMPPLVPVATPMAFELAAYAAVCGLLYPILMKKLPSHLPAMLCALVISMIAGRLVGGAAKAIVMGLNGGSYSFNAFIAAYFTGTAIGAVIHIILVPVVVTALEKAKLSPMTTNK